MKVIVAIFVLIIVGVFAVVSAFMPKIYCYNNKKEEEKDDLICWGDMTEEEKSDFLYTISHQEKKKSKNKNFRERYKKIAQSKWFEKVYQNISIGEQIKIEE